MHRELEWPVSKATCLYAHLYMVYRHLYKIIEGTSLIQCQIPITPVHDWAEPPRELIPHLIPPSRASPLATRHSPINNVAKKPFPTSPLTLSLALVLTYVNPSTAPQPIGTTLLVDICNRLAARIGLLATSNRGCHRVADCWVAASGSPS